MCDFTLVNRGSAINAHANVFILSSTTPQSVLPGRAVRFTNAETFAGVLWNGGDTLVLRKGSTYKIEFILNYVTQAGTVQAGLTVNDILQTGTFARLNNLPNGISQLVGTYILRLNAGDSLQIINTTQFVTITLASTGTGSQPERVASFNLTELY